MLPCKLGLSMWLISNIGIEIVKDAKIDPCKEDDIILPTIIKAYIYLFLHMLWYAPLKFVMLWFFVLLIMQNCNGLKII